MVFFRRLHSIGLRNISGVAVRQLWKTNPGLRVTESNCIVFPRLLTTTHLPPSRLHRTNLLPSYNNPAIVNSRLLSSSSVGFREQKSRKPVSDNEEDESKLGLVARFKLMYKRYWYVLIPVHTVTSIVWYGSFFIAAKNGVDIVPVLQSIGVTSETILGHLKDGNAGYYAIAYAMYKVATPARYTVTLGCTTVSINYLKNRGYIKPVPSKEKLQEIYSDKTAEMKEKFEERRDEFRDKYKEQHKEMNKRLDEGKAEIRQRLAGTKEIIEDRTENVMNKIEDIKRIPRVKSTKKAFHKGVGDVKHRLSRLTSPGKTKKK